MWSLGCVLYEMITRERAFPTDFAVFQYGSSSIPPPALLTALDEDTSGLLWPFYVHDLLAVDSAGRPSARKLKEYHQIPMFLLSSNIQPHGYLGGLRGGVPTTSIGALELAVTKGRLDIAEAVLKLDVDLSATKERGDKLLQLAIEQRNLEMVGLLVRSGADTRCHIIEAVSIEDVDTLRALIEAGADIRAIGDNGVSAFEVARSKDNLEIIKLFGDTGALETDFETVCVTELPGLKQLRLLETSAEIHGFDGDVDAVSLLFPELFDVKHQFDDEWESYYQTAWDAFSSDSRSIVSLLPSQFKREGNDWFAILNKDIYIELDISLEQSLGDMFAGRDADISFSQSGKYFGMWGDVTALIFATKPWKLLGTLEHEEEVREFSDPGIAAACFHTDGVHFATAGTSIVLLWNLSTMQMERRICDISDLVILIRFASYAERLTIVNFHGDVELFDTESGRKLRGHTFGTFEEDPLTALSVNGKYIARGQFDSESRRARIWRMDGGGESNLVGDYSDIDGVWFSPNGDLVTALNGTTKVYEVWPSAVEGFTQSKAKVSHINTKLVRTFVEPGNGRITDVSSSEDGKWLGTAWNDGRVTFWNRHNVVQTPQLKLHCGLETRSFSLHEQADCQSMEIDICSNQCRKYICCIRKAGSTYLEIQVIKHYSICGYLC